MLETFASGFLVFAYFAIALFHLAIVFGAPLAEYSYGGQLQGRLPIRYRITSVFSVGLMLAFAGHYLAQLGILPTLLEAKGNQIANWVLVGFAALAALMNNITRGKKEKQLWGSTTLAILVAAFLVAF